MNSPKQEEPVWEETCKPLADSAEKYLRVLSSKVHSKYILGNLMVKLQDITVAL